MLFQTAKIMAIDFVGNLYSIVCSVRIFFFFLSRSLFILNNARNHLHWFCQMVNLVLYHGCGIELITIAYLSLFNYLSEKDKNKNNSYDFTVSVCECANISGFFTNQPTNQPFSIGYRIFYVGKKKVCD